MTARTAEIAGGSDGDALLGSPANRPLQPQPVLVVARKSSHAGLSGTERPSLNPETVIESSERPMVVVGRKPYRKSQMRSIRRHPAFWLAAVILCTVYISAAANAGRDNARLVKPVSWPTFSKGHPDTKEAVLLRDILADSCRYMTRNLQSASERDIKVGGHNNVRQVSLICFALATAIKLGVYDEAMVGVPESRAISCTRTCISKVANAHPVNRVANYSKIRHRGFNEDHNRRIGKFFWADHNKPRGLWSWAMVSAAWYLWNELSEAERRAVTAVIICEADRHAGKKRKTWNGKGGNTRAETIAWDARPIELALAMMPNHPHATDWQARAIRYRLTTAARQSDLENKTVYHGKTVLDWIDGFNYFDDGSVVNHGIHPHPSYMKAAVTNIWGANDYCLASRPIPLAYKFNIPVVYRCFVDKHWPAGKYAKPGGTILKPDGTVYWPDRKQREKWKSRGAYKWGVVGLSVHAWRLDEGASVDGNRLGIAFLTKTRQAQVRRKNGSTGSHHKGEGAVCCPIASTYLTLWLQHQGVLRFSNETPENIVITK